MKLLQSNESCARIAQSLGLAKQENTDKLMNKIIIQRNIAPEPHHHLAQVYCRTHRSGAQTYMYSLFFRVNKDDSIDKNVLYQPIETNALAFIFPSWKLHFISCRPRLNRSEIISNSGNNFARKPADIVYEQIRFPHILGLDEKYETTTPELPPRLVRPSDGFLRTLALHPGITLFTGGDMLTLSYADWNKELSGFPNEEKVKQLYKIGLELAREL